MIIKPIYLNRFLLHTHFWGDYSTQDFYLLDNGEFFISDITRLPLEYPKVREKAEEGKLTSEQLSKIKEYLDKNATEDREFEERFRGCEVEYRQSVDKIIRLVNDFDVFDDLRMLIPRYNSFYHEIYLELM